MEKSDLQKVRDAFISLNPTKLSVEDHSRIRHALYAIDAALAAEPKSAVWMQSDHLHKAISHACGADSFLARCSHRQLMPDYQPLFLTPPSREWQGLSADEIQRTLEVCQTTVSDPLWSAFAEAIEAALKEKNHG